MLDEERFWAKVQRSDRCWEWQGARNWFGYGLLRIDGRQTRAHRVAYQLVIGPIPLGMNVLHRCDNPPCARPDHLFVGTQRDNLSDMTAKGRRRSGHVPQTGSLNNYARLTEADIPAIRRAIAAGEYHDAIAARYGVHRATISQIARGFSWRHV